MLMRNTENNKYSLDTLKFFLSIMVVFIHSRIFLDSSVFLDTFTSNGIFRIAVPIFFVINGYYLPIDKNKFKSWLYSSIILYLSLTIFYCYFWVDRSSIQAIIESIILKTTTGFLHLWYIQAMIIAGIIIYTIGKYKYILQLSIVLFILGWCLQLYHSYQYVYDQTTSYNYQIYRNALTIALPFMIIGKSLRNVQFSTFKKHSLFIFGLVSFSFEIYLNYYYFSSRQINNITLTFDVYLSLIFICPFIFVCAMNLNYGVNINRKIPNYIYFIHPLPMLIFNRFMPDSDRILVSFMIAIVSILISYAFLKLSPRINNIVKFKTKTSVS
ncbi:TPA: acyltransferase family protein [Klebsiella pneumoniae subsp. pneumoniae]|nr:acyltransferase family protein [Klebsiella pneumoniae]HDS4972517.1 acyltransferase family protein [Klebsiella pneumoniae subsp. pneumoniae]